MINEYQQRLDAFVDIYYQKFPGLASKTRDEAMAKFHAVVVGAVEAQLPARILDVMSVQMAQLLDMHAAVDKQWTMLLSAWPGEGKPRQ